MNLRIALTAPIQFLFLVVAAPGDLEALQIDLDKVPGIRMLTPGHRIMLRMSLPGAILLSGMLAQKRASACRLVITAHGFTSHPQEQPGTQGIGNSPPPPVGFYEAVNQR
jgi:hypothetical protein